MNHEQFERSKEIMRSALAVLSSEGIAVDEPNNAIPILSAARDATVSFGSGIARAKDAALRDEPIGLGFADDDLIEEPDDEDDGEFCEDCHRALDELIDSARRRRKRPASDLEHNRRSADKTATHASKLFNSAPPRMQPRTRGFDVMEDDLQHFARLAYASCGCY